MLRLRAVVTRILILSARPPVSATEHAAHVDRAREPRLDVVVDDVVAEVFGALRDELGYAVAHAEVATASEIERAVRAHRPTVVFNLCESLEGESRFESVVPVLLEQLGVACTGSPGDALRTCLHKFEANEVLRRAGVRVPFTRRVAHADEVHAIPLPAIVKPDREDGSVGIDGGSVVRDLHAARARVRTLVSALSQPVVIQGYVEGREISVSFLDAATGEAPRPRALPLGEIAFDTDVAGCPSILTYAAKWHVDSVDFVGTRPVSAALSPTATRKIVAAARAAYDALGLRDYGRVDLRVDPRGEPWVIDVNPNCDLGHEGALMRAGRRAGLDRAGVLARIVRAALARAVRRASIAVGASA